MYLIERVKVRISMQATDGRDMTLTELGRGDFFGEMALLDGERRFGGCDRCGGCTIMLPREHFLSFVRSNLTLR